jgi:hypothetical protein
MRFHASLPTLSILVGLFTLAACGGDGPEVVGSSPTTVAAVTSTTGEVMAESTPTAGGDGGDSTSAETDTETTATIPDTTATTGVSTSTSQPPPSPEPPPWLAAPIDLAALPDVYRLEWAEAGEPSTCPFLALADLGPEAEHATIRRAEHDHEMLVVWDNPDGPGHDTRGEPCDDCGRGVVGLGTWPDGANAVGPATISWDDGSFANIDTLPWVYGVSARIHPAGADCMYQLWSHIGSQHVEYLISQLRQVET